MIARITKRLKDDTEFNSIKGVEINWKVRANLLDLKDTPSQADGEASTEETEQPSQDITVCQSDKADIPPLDIQ